MGSSAVLLFTAAALLLVLAELGQSAPAQEDQSLKEAMDGEYNQWTDAVEKYYKQLSETQAYYSPEQLVQAQNYYRGAQAQGDIIYTFYHAVGRLVLQWAYPLWYTVHNIVSRRALTSLLLADFHATSCV